MGCGGGRPPGSGETHIHSLTFYLPVTLFSPTPFFFCKASTFSSLLPDSSFNQLSLISFIYFLWHHLICTLLTRDIPLPVFFTHNSRPGKSSINTRNTWVPTPITTALTSVYSHFTALHSSQWDKLATNPIWIELSLLALGCEVINDEFQFECTAAHTI